MFVSVVGNEEFWQNTLKKHEKYASYTTSYDLSILVHKIGFFMEMAERDKQYYDLSPSEFKGDRRREYLKTIRQLESKKRDAAELWCPSDLRLPRDAVFNLTFNPSDPWINYPSGMYSVKPLEQGSEKQSVVKYLEYLEPQLKINSGDYYTAEFNRRYTHLLHAAGDAKRDLNTICERRLAYCMATHPRLGASSLLPILSPDVFRHIGEYVAFPGPQLQEADPAPVETQQADETDPLPAAVQEVDMQPPNTLATLLRSAWDGLMSILGLKRRRH